MRPSEPRARELVVLGVESSHELDEDCRIDAVLAGLGARVVGLELFAPATEVLARSPRAVFVDAGGRLDYAAQVVRALRRTDTGCCVLLALHERQLSGLDPKLPFDDFVVAPYLPSEVLARLHRAEWQKSAFIDEEQVKIGDLYLDTGSHQVWCRGRKVELTHREFQLAAYLLRERGKVHSREQLLRAAWGADYEGGARTVDVHVRRLRAKLGEALPLATVRGSGYIVQLP